jgi:hypothetical protein
MPPVVRNPPRVPIFALAPAKAIEGPLDYNKAEHSKIYKSAIRAVSDDAFNCEADGLFQFLQELQDRSIEMGWMEGILKIPLNNEEVEDEEEVEEENLLVNYGSITLEQVVNSELRYIQDQTRKAQDTYMLYRCLMASLTSEAKKKVMIWSDQYQIGDNKMSSGVALLKVIIRESHLDTSATTNQIRTKLSALDTYILTINSDIGKFNQYVKLLVQSLTARNQKTSDLLINLFKAYGSVSDEVFRAWLVRKQDDHDEGNELTPDELMMAAKNKYDTMVEKGTWNAPSAEEKIVALEAKFNSVTKTLTKKLAAKGATQGTKSGKKQKEDGKGDHPKKWKPPKPTDKKEVPFKGHTWYWCGKDTGGKCEKWRAHKPSDCQWKENPPGGEDRKRKGSPATKATDKKLKVARAYVAKLEQKKSEEEEKGTDSGSE